MEVPHVGRKVLAGCTAGLILSGLVLLSSCAYFVGQPIDLVPLPDTVGIQALPEILSCSATFVLRTSEDHFERICGFNCWDRDEEEWRFCCRDVWQYTECLGDVVVRMTVNDPSDDLDSTKSPRVRVMDSLPVAGADERGSCQINVLQTDIPISPYDVSGSDAGKTVLVRISDVALRFTARCHTFRAVLPVMILFDDDGQALRSQNTSEATIEYSHH
jgi:hypothetical protein